VRPGAALVLALAALALVPGRAAAHATLESTVPARGARLAHAPAQVVLRFDESVNAQLGAVEVFDARGRAVQSGGAFHPGGVGAEVAVRLPASLPAGGYTATYRVLSADSHPISGGFAFTIGSGPPGRASVGELLRGQTAGPVTSTAFAVVRAVEYAAIALGLGTAIFVLVCWPAATAPAAAAAAFAARTRALLVGAALAGAAAAVAGIALEGAVGEGSSVWSALRGGVVGDVLSTRFGTVWAAAALGWLAIGTGALVRLPARVLAIPLAALALLPALSGHPAVQSPVWLLAPANVLHVVAMAAWLGGIAVLVLALRAATSRLEPAARTPLLVAVVARFSALAGGAFAVLLVTGAVQGVVEVASVGALVHTAFGRAAAIKLVLFTALVALGWANRARLLPALRATGESPLRAGVLLRRTLRAELALGVVVLAVTGALAGYPPSTAVSSGPVSREATVGPAHLELTVDPATVGPNQLHLYLFDHRTGARFTAAKQVTVTAALPAKGIGAIPFDVRRAGPGHAIGTGTLGVAGDWRLTVTVRVSAFDEYVTRLTLPIR
jgi:copper transport protein